MLACLLTTSTALAEPTPVAIELKGPGSPSFADDIEATIRLALNGSGAFYVVRTDLKEKISKAQKRFFSEAYRESARLEVGEFITPHILVSARHGKARRGAVSLRVSFTDMQTLKSVKALDLRHRLDLENLEASAAELALEIAKRVAKTKGGELSGDALAQAQTISKLAENRQAVALRRRAQKQARRLTHASLRRASELLRRAQELTPKDLGILIDLLQVEVSLARFSEWLGEDNEDASLRRHDRIVRLTSKLRPLMEKHWMAKRAVASAELYLSHLEEFDALIPQILKAQPKDPDTLYLSALRAATRNGSTALLSGALRIDPLHAQARIVRAQNYSQQGELDRARTDLRWVLQKIAPDNLVARLMLADLEYLSAHITRARKLLEPARKAHPRSFHTNMRLALYRAATRKRYQKPLMAAVEASASSTFALVPHPQSALYIKRAEALHRRWPTHPMIALDLARQYLTNVSKLDQGRALEVLDRVKHRKMPQTMRTILGVHRAFALAGTGRPEEALTSLEPLRGSREASAWIDLFKARYLSQTGQTDQARRTLSQLVEIATDPVLTISATTQLAMAYSQKGEYKLAHRFIDRLRGIPGTRALRALFQGRVFTAQGEKDRAKQAYLEGLKDHGGFGEIRAQLAELYIADKQEDRGIEQLRRAAERDLNYLSALVIKLVQLEKSKQARSILADFLVERPQDARVLTAKGHTFYLLNEYEIAKTAYMDAYLAAPSWTRARAVLRALDALKRPQEASRFLKHAMEKAGRERPLYERAIAERTE